MSEENNKKPTTKKYKTIDRDLVFKLAAIQCTQEEIAEVVGLGVEALRRRFGTIIEKGKQAGRKSLRRAQWDKALNGDTRLLIFLGKQYLSQKDQIDDNANKSPLPWDDDKN